MTYAHDAWKLICETWHTTPDKWHLTCDTGHIRNSEYYVKIAGL